MAVPKALTIPVPNRIQPAVVPEPGKAGVYTNQIHYVKKHLLDELVKKKFASPFLYPVDAEALQVPLYYKVISKPMDVRTIIMRVQNNFYGSVDDVLADVRLICENCFNFNRKDTAVYRKGLQLEKFYHRTVQNIPKGPAVPCNKDPIATFKLKINPMALGIEQECRDQLKKLQFFTNQADATARNFFAPKWDSFCKKLDKQYFKSLEEFGSNVDGVFKKYHDPAKMIYEKTYDRPGRFGGDAPRIPPFDVSEILLAVQLTENGLRQCLKQPQRGKTLVETFCATVAQFKHKLEAIKSASDAQDASFARQAECSARRFLQNESLVRDSQDGDDSGDDQTVELVGYPERRILQDQTTALPCKELRQLAAVSFSVEPLHKDSTGQLSIDLETFQPQNVHIIKHVLHRVTKMMNKRKIKDMQPAEKEDLRCNLENKLVDITERLSQSRRKNAASLSSDKNYNMKNANNGGSHKRGKGKGAKSPEPEAGPSSSGASKQQASPKPNLRAGAAGPDGGHSGRWALQGMATPGNPKRYGQNPTGQRGQNRVGRLPSSRIPAVLMTPRRILGSQTPKLPVGFRTPSVKGPPARGRGRGRGRGVSYPTKPVQNDKKKSDEGKKRRGNATKHAASFSSDEDSSDDERANNKPRPKKARLGKKQSELCITPGNVLHSDLSVSSSSSSGSDSD